MYEEKIRKMKKNRWVKRCWKEKERKSWEDLYGRERERYYNRNGWGICAKEINDEENNKVYIGLLEREKRIRNRIQK